MFCSPSDLPYDRLTHDMFLAHEPLSITGMLHVPPTENWAVQDYSGTWQQHKEQVTGEICVFVHTVQSLLVQLWITPFGI